MNAIFKITAIISIFTAIGCSAPQKTPARKTENPPVSEKTKKVKPNQPDTLYNPEAKPEANPEATADNSVRYSIAKTVDEAKKRDKSPKFRAMRALDELLSPTRLVRDRIYSRSMMMDTPSATPIMASNLNYLVFAKNNAPDLLEIISAVESLKLNKSDLKITTPAKGEFDLKQLYLLANPSYKVAEPALVNAAKHQRWDFVTYAFIFSPNTNTQFVAYMYLHQNNAVPAGLKKRLEEMVKEVNAGTPQHPALPKPAPKKVSADIKNETAVLQFQEPELLVKEAEPNLKGKVYAPAKTIEEAKKRAFSSQYRAARKLDGMLSPEKIRDYYFTNGMMMKSPAPREVVRDVVRRRYREFAKNNAPDLIDIITAVGALKLGKTELKIAKPAEGKFDLNVLYKFRSNDFAAVYPLLMKCVKHQRWDYVTYAFMFSPNSSIQFTAYLYLHQNKAVPAGLKKRLEEMVKEVRKAEADEPAPGKSENTSPKS